MQYAAIASNQRLAKYDFDEYIKEHRPHIKTINKQNLTIILNNDDSITFISETLYDRWCKGRTYKILGDEDHLYRSGHIQLESIYGVQSTEINGVKISNTVLDIYKELSEKYWNLFTALPKIIQKYIIWKRWVEGNVNSKSHKLAVLLGIIHSPTFENMKSWFYATQGGTNLNILMWPKENPSIKKNKGE